MKMSEFIEVRAGETIRRPIHEVRGQYGDIDHHIRHNVHPGITFTWVDGKDSTRLVRTEFSLLGMKQYDLTQFVDAPDGTLLLNHLEGANTGTVIEHRFRAIDDNTTDVQLVARVPASTGRKLLGPLFRFGVRQLLVKALGEDKKDLEGSGYRAGAAGNVEAAVGLFSSATLSEPALLAVLRAACLTSAADGEVDKAERDAIVRALSKLAGKPFGADAVDRELASACAVEASGMAAHAESLGRDMASAGVASVGLAVAATIAAASRGIAYAELGVLKGLAAGGGLPDAIVESTLAAVEKALSA
jgi:hypothetical protein